MFFRIMVPTPALRSLRTQLWVSIAWSTGAKTSREMIITIKSSVVWRQWFFPFQSSLCVFECFSYLHWNLIWPVHILVTLLTTRWIPIKILSHIRHSNLRQTEQHAQLLLYLFSLIRCVYFWNNYSYLILFRKILDHLETHCVILA